MTFVFISKNGTNQVVEKQGFDSISFVFISKMEQTRQYNNKVSIRFPLFFHLQKLEHAK